MQSLQRITARRYGGWISGELVAAVLIFTILLVAAMPLRRSARAAANRARCETVRRIIATALADRLAEGKEGLGHAISDPPRCPSGGAFLIRRVAGQTILDSHGTPIPPGATYISCSEEGHLPIAVTPSPSH